MARTTLESWMKAQSIPAPLARIFAMTADCGIEISVALRVATASGQNGKAGSVNVQGEEQKALDIVANDIFLRRGAASGVLSAMVSEELEDIWPVEAAGPDARYALVFDPLDGSSNLEVNGAVGSIFSVLDIGKAAGVTKEDVLQTGTQQVAAGYILYGPATVLVLTTGESVTMFGLDEVAAEFVLVEDGVQIPVEANEFAINMSRYHQWYAPTRGFIEDCLSGKDGPLGKPYNMRWCAAMVADLHRILCRGGVFLYPEDEGTKARGGRLRLMYEANPMSLIVEAAGGAASTGTTRVLSIEPSDLHQRVGIIIGSRAEVETACQYYADRARPYP
ncbi:class 1 fructose-bisphosphatase [Pelagibacterium xiamenense]|uniref:class 1 fructose-bisphosphatase n=1 Tax=Pelagibacterium xiamenense TaxID=2901140 RepID=UPI001E310608|nr:class 1 fructose-bisphosphatase [Pelagibacterium xiamenense]MCD7059825.1 class 1 fructose-bisphosphatase [Pelagibacterium xiamenense]